MQNMKTLIETLNASSTKFTYELNENLRFTKGQQTWSGSILKATKKGTKRVFFVPTNCVNLLCKTLFARKNEAISLAKAYAKTVLN